MAEQYVVGVDFGSASVRAIVVSTLSGNIISTGISSYPRWEKGLYQHPEEAVYRQHPLDYLESLEKCVREAADKLPEEKKGLITGIGVDTTGSTPVPVTREGIPLSLTEGFEENENAMFWLWKDHSAAYEAGEITELFSHNNICDYCRYQGDYSSEWFWAKILRGVRIDASIREKAYTWVEHSDWIAGVLGGNTNPEEISHNACAAGHKALWNSHWQGLPSGEILSQLDPYLALVRERYGRSPQPAGQRAGSLCREWAERLGLQEGIAVAVGSFDAHAGAVGAGIREKTLVTTIGTSAVDMLIARPEAVEGKEIRRFCGQAENAIYADFTGIETGQSAFGDIFAWFKNMLLWPAQQMAGRASGDSGELQNKEALRKTMEEELLGWLQAEAEKLPDEPFPISLDWYNGRRYPDTDDQQKAVIKGLSLGTTAPELYRALVFGAASGLKRICDGLEDAGLEIDEVIAVGGISKKSSYVMQLLSDLLKKKIIILASDQTCALGAAIYGAVASGAKRDIGEACRDMASKPVGEFLPNPRKSRLYDSKYQEYLALAEAMT